MVTVTKGKGTLKKLKKGSIVKVPNNGSKERMTRAGMAKKPRFNPYKLSYTARGSERERLDNAMSLDVEGGFSVAPAISTGVALGAFVSHNTVFELSYAKGAADLGIKEAIPGQLEFQSVLDTEVATLRFKNFFGNSFYTNTGVGARKSTITANPSLVADILPVGDGPLFSQSRADAVFEFSIGNKWQASFVTFGIDWVGLMAPISKIRLENGGNNLPEEDNFQAITQYNGQEPFDKSEFDRDLGTTFSSKIYVGFSF